MDVISLCTLAEVAERGIGSADLPGGRRIAIYLVDGKAFATDDQCTHGSSSLADEGCLEGHVVECGMHLGTFDVRTGEALGPPCSKALRTYPVEIRDDRVVLTEAALTGTFQA